MTEEELVERLMDEWDENGPRMHASRDLLRRIARRTARELGAYLEPELFAPCEIAPESGAGRALLSVPCGGFALEGHNRFVRLRNRLIALRKSGEPGNEKLEELLRIANGQKEV